MSKTFVTQCPHCSTRFRVNSNQLFAAQGAVRCGSCMQVFNARLFLEQESNTATTAQQPTTEAPAATQPTAPALDTLKIHDDLDIDLDSPDFEQELARLAMQEAEENRAVSEPQSKPEINAAELAQEDNSAAQHTTEYNIVPPFPADEPDAAPIYPHASLAAEPPTTQADDPHTATESAPNTSGRQEPAVDLYSLESIAEDPLFLEWQAPQRSGSLWWFLCSVLAALGLLVQYAYYNSEQLAGQPATRPLLEAACKLTGCSVPERVDVSQITSSNLVVRPHPEYPEALRVDAILYNRAGFTQPFPLLQLNFRDERTELLASRTFAPGEYLGGELAGQRSMPAQIPIRIALDVLAPDGQAASYEIRFLANE